MFSTLSATATSLFVFPRQMLLFFSRLQRVLHKWKCVRPKAKNKVHTKLHTLLSEQLISSELEEGIWAQAAMPCPSEEEYDLVDNKIIMRLFSLATMFKVFYWDLNKVLGKNFGFMSNSDINHIIYAFHRPPILVVSHTLMKFREENQRRRIMALPCWAEGISW